MRLMEKKKNSDTNVSLPKLIRDIALILFHVKTEQNMFLVVRQQNVAWVSSPGMLSSTNKTQNLVFWFIFGVRFVADST